MLFRSAPLPPESVAIEDLPALLLSSDAAAMQGPGLAGAADPALPAHFEEHVQALLAPRLARLVDTTLQSVRTELALEVQVLVRQAIEEALSEPRRG